MSVKTWVREEEDTVAWLYIDGKLIGTFLKSQSTTMSVTFNRDASLFYGFYVNDDDLQWIMEKYDLLYG